MMDEIKEFFAEIKSEWAKSSLKEKIGICMMIPMLLIVLSVMLAIVYGILYILPWWGILIGLCLLSFMVGGCLVND